MNTTQLLHWIKEREAIRVRRANGDPSPGQMTQFSGNTVSAMSGAKTTTPPNGSQRTGARRTPMTPTYGSR